MSRASRRTSTWAVALRPQSLSAVSVKRETEVLPSHAVTRKVRLPVSSSLAGMGTGLPSKVAATLAASLFFHVTVQFVLMSPSLVMRVADGVSVMPGRGHSRPGGVLRGGPPRLLAVKGTARTPVAAAGTLTVLLPVTRPVELAPVGMVWAGRPWAATRWALLRVRGRGSISQWKVSGLPGV